MEQQPVDLFYRVGLNRWNGEEMLQVVVEDLRPAALELPLPVPALRVSLPELVDRRGVEADAVRAEFPSALVFGEGVADGVDRYGLRQTEELVLLTPFPSPRLLDEAVARSGARRVVLAWPARAHESEDRFLPALLKLVGAAMEEGPYVSIARLAVQTGELEVTVRLGVEALAQSHLLAVDEEQGDQLRLRRRTDGRGVLDSAALGQMRRIIAESRAYRRFLRTASVSAVVQSLYLGR
jgi:single-stranded-DNA-specific exonuclease